MGKAWNTSHTINVRWTWEGRGKTSSNYVHTKSDNEFITSQAEYSSHIFPSLPHETQVYQRMQVCTFHDHDALEAGFWSKGVGGVPYDS